MDKVLAKHNRKIAMAYWRSYLFDGQLMAWLIATEDGELFHIEEPQGQSEIWLKEGEKLLHSFGSFWRSCGDMPEKITFKKFIQENGLEEYLSIEKPLEYLIV